MTLRDLRVQRGLTQAQLAELAGVSQPSLSQYERGDILPSLESARRVAQALGVSVEAMMDALGVKVAS